MILLMAEILHQLIGSLSHYLQGFIHPRWCRISAINSMLKFLFSIFSINTFFYPTWETPKPPTFDAIEAPKLSHGNLGAELSELQQRWRKMEEATDVCGEKIST